MNVLIRSIIVTVDVVVLAVVSMGMSQIKNDEVVVFYPTYAHLDGQGKIWNVPVHGAIFEPDEDSIKRKLLISAIRDRLDVKKGTPQAQMFDRRARLFMVDNERRKEISVQLGSRIFGVGQSKPNGHFGAVLQIPVAEAKLLVKERQSDAPWITFHAVTRQDDRRRFEGRVQLIGDSGLSIISDIDDTIKHSQVADRKALLRNTFLEDFESVPGMAELYRGAAQRGAVFHYVSASPWQLYRPLADFCRKEGFPPGSFHLKLFRLKDSSALGILGSHEETKLRAIEPILAAFPKRRFVLIGDSGEQDPEIFGKVARSHQDRVAAILIRNVTDEPADAERFRAAFEGIDRERWKVFGRPEELKAVLWSRALPGKKKLAESKPTTPKRSALEAAEEDAP